MSLLVILVNGPTDSAKDPVQVCGTVVALNVIAAFDCKALFNAGLTDANPPR